MPDILSALSEPVARESRLSDAKPTRFAISRRESRPSSAKAAAIKVNFYEQTMGANFRERQLSVRDIAIHTYGDNAWVEFYWDFVAKRRKDGSPLTTHGRETQVYRKINGEWRLVHAHYSGMPVTGDRRGF